MKVLIEINEDIMSAIKDYDVSPSQVDTICEQILNSTPLNGTNGDVLKAVFPNVVIIHKIRENKREIVFSDDCWNADYKGVE